jgi:diguanylate cyclase (GGDEF)-like protein
MTEAALPDVLIADGDAVSSALAAQVIRSAGYRVISERDGADAMQTLLREGPPLIVMDWELPRMSGPALCRAIRTHEGISFAYIVVLASKADEDQIVEAFEAGADDYLAKPFNERELLARLRAGVRVIQLQRDLERRNREVHRVNAEMAVAQARLTEAHERLKRLAATDELTGLTNRREGMARLAEYWSASERHGEPLALIQADIDRFKRFNDAYGHAVGDVVLKETAAVMQATARREEKVCRLGGEEFLVLCPRSTEAMVAVAAERLRQAVAAHVVKTGGQELSITMSFGVAERTADMRGPDDLTKAADDALYAAKRAGRNRVCLASESPAVAMACDTPGPAPHL